MITKRVGTTIDSSQSVRVMCPKCEKLVPKTDMISRRIPATGEVVEVCLRCYNDHH